MPYYPLDFDAKKAIPKVARAVPGVTPGDVLWGLTDLWEHVFLTRGAEVTELVLDGCFGPNPRLREALIAYGFLEPTENGWRVKGSSRLLGVANQKSEAGKARTSKAQRDQRGRLVKSSGTSGPPAAAGQPLDVATSGNPALTPSTKHQAPIEKNPLAGGAEKPAATQVPAKANSAGTEPAFIRPKAGGTADPADLREVVEQAFLRTTGHAVDWGFPNSPKERALRAVAAMGTLTEVSELVSAAFEPTGFTWTLEQIPHNRDAILQKAAKLRAKAAGASPAAPKSNPNRPTGVVPNAF